MGVFLTNIDRPNSILHQRHHLGSEALQALDAFGDALAAEVEDQLVHADRGERTDVAGVVMVVAGAAAAVCLAGRKRRWCSTAPLCQGVRRSRARPALLPS